MIVHTVLSTTGLHPTLGCRSFFCFYYQHYNPERNKLTQNECSAIIFPKVRKGRKEYAVLFYLPQLYVCLFRSSYALLLMIYMDIYFRFKGRYGHESVAFLFM